MQVVGRAVYLVVMDTVGTASRPMYYRQSAAAVIETLHSHKMGLTNATAERRHAADGTNILPQFDTEPIWQEWLRAFVHPLTLGLVVAGLLAYILDQTLFAAALAALILLDATIRWLITRRYLPQPLLELTEHSSVLRNGQIRRIETAQLVIGDIVMLQPDDIVPADLRLLATDNLLIDESLLFGVRSVAVAKSTRSIRTRTPLSQQANTAWMGTRVLDGTAAGIVTGIGARTELRRIVLLANEARKSRANPAWHWSNTWILVGLTFVGIALLGWLNGIEARGWQLGLLVLDLSLLPLGTEITYIANLLHMRPRPDLHLSTLAQLGAIDTLMTTELSIARFKMFGLHVLHIGHNPHGLAVHELSDGQLSLQIRSGSASFGELTAEDMVRLVRSAQAGGHRVAVVVGSLDQIPAALLSDAAVIARNDLAALLVGAQAARTLTLRLRDMVFSWTLTFGLLATISVGGFWYAHLPLALSPQLVAAFSIVALPLAAVTLSNRDKRIPTTELVTRGSALSVIAYSAYLLSFSLHNVDPSYIDPSNPLAVQALTAVFALLITCLGVERMLTSALSLRTRLALVGTAAAVLFLASYNSGLQSVLGTTAPDAAGWLLVGASGGLYAALLLLQRHSRHHSRSAIVRLHRRTFGRTSGARI